MFSFFVVFMATFRGDKLVSDGESLIRRLTPSIRRKKLQGCHRYGEPHGNGGCLESESEQWEHEVPNVMCFSTPSANCQIGDIIAELQKVAAPPGRVVREVGAGRLNSREEL